MWVLTLASKSKIVCSEMSEVCLNKTIFFPFDSQIFFQKKTHHIIPFGRLLLYKARLTLKANCRKNGLSISPFFCYYWSYFMYFPVERPKHEKETTATLHIIDKYSATNLNNPSFYIVITNFCLQLKNTKFFGGQNSV